MFQTLTKIVHCNKITCNERFLLFSFRLYVGILLGDVRDAGAILRGVEVVVTYNQSLGISPVQFLKQLSHGSLLGLSARVGGLTADVEPALVADAYRMGVVVQAVGADHVLRTALFNLSVTTDDVVVADAELPALPAVPCVDLGGRRCLAGPYCTAVNHNQCYRSHLSLMFKDLLPPYNWWS